MRTEGENKDNIFGERLKKLRSITMGMNQRDFAKLLGIPQPNLSAYESGRNKPTIDTVINISNKCNVSIDWLCGKDSSSRIDSLGDLLSVFLDLYDSKEFSFRTEIQDNIDIEGDKQNDDATRNWIKLTFFYNENRYDESLVYSTDVCQLLDKAYQLHNQLLSYELTQDDYEEKKALQIERYNKYPLTRKELPDISPEERIKRRIAYLTAQLEASESKKRES